MHVNTSGKLSAAVADAGTFTVSYPSRPAPDAGVYNEGDFFNAVKHQLVMGQATLTYPDDFGLTFGTAGITVTNKTGATWPAESEWILSLDIPGKPVFLPEGENGAKVVNRASRADTVLINLGAPDTLDADGVCAAQKPAGAGAMTLNGALVSNGVATFDVPRNVVVTSDGDDSGVTFTVTGKDEYGNTMVETITGPNTTTAAGKKAFKTISSVKISGAGTGNITVGNGDVLGLPVFLPSAAHVLQELENGAVAMAGTLVAGAIPAGGSTATSGDVRGTYDPNSAADGDKVFQLIVSLPDPTFLGAAQFAG